MIRKYILILVACGFLAWPATPANNFFHLMQIEQVIGGVNGDDTAQAIQLRMRDFEQCFITGTTVWVRDATGNNPILLIQFLGDVPGCNPGDRILIASPNFSKLLDNPIAPDFLLTNLIPQSYFAAGSLTFEDGGGTVYWRLSWGGKSYTGDTTGVFDNDADGEFSPNFPGPLPSTTLQALLFPGSAAALSTNNQADYLLTKGASTWTNDANESGTLIEGIPCPWDLDGSGTVNTSDLLALFAQWGTDGPADFDESGTVNTSDLLILFANWGPCP